MVRNVIGPRLRWCAYATAVILRCATAAAAPHPSAGRTDLVTQTKPVSSDALADEDALVKDIIAQSFPTLQNVDVRLQPFTSDSDYFRTSFSATRFLSGRKMRYYVGVNPEWRTQGAPIDGVRSILAHELAHIEELSHGNRMRLFRLTGLLFKGKTAHFERRADLTVLARDYGLGLKAYRTWLYDHVPAGALEEKRRDYFSPDEIDAILAVTASRHDLFDWWRQHVPMTLTDIQTVR